MVGVGRPPRAVQSVRLVSPNTPPLAHAAREQLQVRPPAAGFNDRVLFVGLAGVFPLPAAEIVHLAPARRQGSSVLSMHAKQKHLGHIAEIKPNSATIGAPVPANLVPNKIRLVLKSPAPHHLK